MQNYTEKFYNHLQKTSQESAKEIIPIVWEFVQPQRVIDVGCGTGTWLSAFKEFGVAEILGVDGDWVDIKMLEIPAENFLALDLTKPLAIDKQFDLVVSLEVAEHLPPECAKIFVGSLVKLGPVILFSAAVPCQGGTNHINEQWPDYWAKLFQEQGYVTIDCLRSKIWQNDRVKWYYAQNIFIFADREYLATNQLLQKEVDRTNIFQLSLIHPQLYLRTASEAIKLRQEIANVLALTDSRISLKKVLFSLLTLTKARLSRKIKQLF
ncbi:MAG: class I SAM-dependent methyltransferase [Microcoleus sp. CSU_2_2]|nr:class I SAM-dependent methyltransferase [Microcoleus sp. SU_5_3]NJS09109.1 class I SAM-dependent methyltransferase [Microcoleus sp. CSU_2_2]